MMTASVAMEALSYDRSTGTLTWRTRPLSHFVDARAHAIWNTKHAGKVASRKSERYAVVCVSGQRYGAHRVVWLLVHGYWPDVIDHINGDGFDNRIENLRSVTVAENNRNQRLRSHSRSGVLGVHWRAKDKRWVAQIRSNGTVKYLGAFKSKEEAAEARATADKLFGFHPNHGRAA